MSLGVKIFIQTISLIVLVFLIAAITKISTSLLSIAGSAERIADHLSDFSKKASTNFDDN